MLENVITRNIQNLRAERFVTVMSLKITNYISNNEGLNGTGIFMVTIEDFSYKD
jgi:hypothetical protein